MKKGHWVSARTCVYNIGYHIVWSTKYRKKVLVGQIEAECRRLFSAIAQANGIEISAMEIMPDHVHLFISAHPKHAPGNLVKILKGGTGKVLLSSFPELKRTFWGGHLWNPSTYYGTVGDISRDVVERYIQMQKSHE